MSSLDEPLGESWVHIQPNSGSGSQGERTPGSVTPQLSVDEYLRLLREAQRESNESSARVSPRSSPKSPPNSPVQGTPFMEWQSYYVNTEPRHEVDVFNDWSSRPDNLPPKAWGFRNPKRDVLSIRCARVGQDKVFSRRGLCTLFLTNLLSLLLGTGVGLWLSKYGFFVPAIKFR